MQKTTENNNSKFLGLQTGLGNKEQLLNFYKLLYNIYIFYKEKVHKVMFYSYPKKIIDNAQMSKMTILYIFVIFRALELVWKVF